MSEIDPELLERIHQKDEAALAEFLNLRQPQLLAFIGKNLSDALSRKVESQDIYSEVCVSALNAFEDVELGDRDPFSWLCQLAERRIIDAHRHHFGAQKRAAGREVGLQNSSGDDSRGGGFLDVLVASMTTASQAFSRDQREFKLLDALQELPEEQRDAIRMRYVEGLPTKEIAEKLGKTDGSIRVMLTRTLNKLQQLLGDDQAFEKYQSPNEDA